MNKTIKIRIGTLEASVSEQCAKDLQRIFGTIVVRQELTSLPEKWYTDGTAEANEWAKAVWRHDSKWDEEPSKFIANDRDSVSNAATLLRTFEVLGHTYITSAQFNEWVYKPWKESLQPKAPTTIEEVLERVIPIWMHDEQELGQMRFPTEAHAKSVLALCQLYNVAKCLNECFEGDCNEGEYWYVAKDGNVYHANPNYADQCVIRFTSRASAQHAAEHFWHLFRDFYMLEDNR